MKLFAGAAVAACLLFASGEPKSPEIFFHKGATFEYNGQVGFADVKDTRYSCVLKIDEVTVDGSHRSCVGAIGYSYRGEAHTNATICRFASDSLNFYASALNFARRSVDEREQAKTNDSGDSLIYPLNMKVGDTLPAAWYKSTKGIPNTATFTDEVHYVKRRVVSFDTLVLGVGTITAYRISMSEVATQTSYSPHTGNKFSSNTRTVTEWFHPGLGIVRMKKDRENGADIIELVGYKLQ